MAKRLFKVFFLVLIIFSDSKAQDKPNILWLTAEDISPYLSSYGNKYTKTPTLDSLAANGIRFSHAYSNGAQCSPARSTLISGIYAPMLGTDWHREERAVPEAFYFPIYLRKAGYYTTNNSKQDYNANNVPDIWNESSNKATYKNRPEDKPFFAIFNYMGTHTKRIATRNVEGRSPRYTKPSEIKLPPYLSDEPWIRDDIAWHYDSVTEMDNWVATKLRELRESGEAKNTIIFFFSDHGGVLPRGKAYLYETGVKVPLIVYFPEKFKHLARVPVPSVSDRLVSFVDFAPTLFSLIGAEIPEFMLGKPFLGDKIVEEREEVFLFRANQYQSFIPSRAITAGRYKFIWNFNSAYPNGTRQPYQWQMPSYQAWDKTCMKGECNKIQKRFWDPMPAWELYDLKKDSMETHNLAYKPAYKKLAKKFSKDLLEKMKEIKDLGLYPWSMRKKDSKVPFYNYVRQSNQNVGNVIQAAALASTASAGEVNMLEDLLQNKNPAIRYWGAIGILQLVVNKKLQSTPKMVREVYRNIDEKMETRLICAEILVKERDDRAALNFIIDQIENNYYTAYAVLQNLGKYAKPVERRLLDLYNCKSPDQQFFLRSTLINTGYLNYDQLWNENISVPK